MKGSAASDPRSVVIFGAGQLARQAQVCASERGLDVAAFAVDDELLGDCRTLHALPVVGYSELPSRFPPTTHAIFVAVGYRRMRARREVFERVRAAGYRCPNLISPHAVVADGVKMSENNLLLAGSVVECDAMVGSNNVLWSGATLCHDTRLGDHNFMAPRSVIAGNCSVGDLCFLGVGALVIDGLSVQSETYLMAGAVLFDNSEQRGRYRGNPARLFGHADAAVGIQIQR